MFDFVGYYVNGLVVGRYCIVVWMDIVVSYIIIIIVVDYIEIGNVVFVFIFNEVCYIGFIEIIIEVLLELY